MQAGPGTEVEDLILRPTSLDADSDCASKPGWTREVQQYVSSPAPT